MFVSSDFSIPAFGQLLFKGDDAGLNSTVYWLLSNNISKYNNSVSKAEIKAGGGMGVS